MQSPRMAEASEPSPWLLRWQGCLPSSSAQQERLAKLASILLILLLAGLPLVTRSGLGLIVLACGALWLLWSFTKPPERLGGISAWLLLFLGVAVLATGFSPVPAAALKGLVKLLSYLGVYALMRQLLAVRPEWWDRLLAALLGGSLLTDVLALRQLYAPTEELARWADPNSVAEGTIRIYGPLGNPNLLAGYLVPILPLALVACIRWRGWGRRMFAATAFILGSASVLFSYSRGGWLALVAALGLLMLLLVLRAIRHWPPVFKRLVPLALLAACGVLLALAVTQVDPIRTRVMSLLAGRGDSSNNFRINVWLAAIDMIQDRPWLGIGPGNAAFNSVYPLYQQPKFNALSAYSVPLELLVETGIPGLIVCIGLALASVRRGLNALTSDADLALPCIGCLAAITGLLVHGAADTIFFRPEVQITGWFCLATLSQCRPRT